MSEITENKILHNIKRDLRKLNLIVKTMESNSDILPEEYQKYVKDFNTALDGVNSNWNIFQSNINNN
jgi:hypothetical protein